MLPLMNARLKTSEIDRTRIPKNGKTPPATCQVATRRTRGDAAVGEMARLDPGGAIYSAVRDATNWAGKVVTG
jgi:hypothetical protein